MSCDVNVPEIANYSCLSLFHECDYIHDLMIEGIHNVVHPCMSVYVCVSMQNRRLVEVDIHNISL